MSAPSGQKPPPWRVRKVRGKWVVRKPDGAHFGSYFTWGEAHAQLRAYTVDVRGGSMGNFDRRGSWDHDSHIYGDAFGFVGPVRCADDGC